jgi:hypothetical protein
MTEYKRIGDHICSHPAFLEVVQVAAAYSGGVDPYEHFIIAAPRFIHLMDRQSPCSFKKSGYHMTLRNY